MRSWAASHSSDVKVRVYFKFPRERFDVLATQLPSLWSIDTIFYIDVCTDNVQCTTVTLAAFYTTEFYFCHWHKGRPSVHSNCVYPHVVWWIRCRLHSHMRSFVPSSTFTFPSTPFREVVKSDGRFLSGIAAKYNRCWLGKWQSGAESESPFTFVVVEHVGAAAWPWTGWGEAQTCLRTVCMCCGNTRGCCFYWWKCVFADVLHGPSVL